MNIRDIPQELLRNSEARRRKREREEFGAACIDAALALLLTISFCIALKILGGK